MYSAKRECNHDTARNLKRVEKVGMEKGKGEEGVKGKKGKKRTP